jgi:histidine triad (HIT) family protein
MLCPESRPVANGAILPGIVDRSAALLASTETSAFDRAAQRRRASMTAYDDQNVFAKILRGEIPCFEVFRDDRSFAFLDIMPRSPGHTLVIPRATARGILDIADDDLAAVARTAKRIAVAAMKAFDAEGIILQQFSEPSSGQVASTCCRRRRARRTWPCSPIMPSG